MLRNLDKYFKSLSAGMNPMQITSGFIHNEPKGIKAFDQKGCSTAKPTQTRLYVFPEMERCILHVITVGTKTDQKGDIKTAEFYVGQLKKA